MKKSLSILCTVLLLALLGACGTTNDTPASEPASTTLPAEEIIPKETSAAWEVHANSHFRNSDKLSPGGHDLLLIRKI